MSRPNSVQSIRSLAACPHPHNTRIHTQHTYTHRHTHTTRTHNTTHVHTQTHTHTHTHAQTHTQHTRTTQHTCTHRHTHNTRTTQHTCTHRHTQTHMHTLSLCSPVSQGRHCPSLGTQGLQLASIRFLQFSSESETQNRAAMRRDTSHELTNKRSVVTQPVSLSSHNSLLPHITIASHWATV